MTEPEFPEDMCAYDAAGNCLGEIEPTRKPIVWRDHTEAGYQNHLEQARRNAEMDAKIIEMENRAAQQRRDRLKYPFRMIQELSFKPAPKRWIVKGLLAKGETSAWIAPEIGPHG
jgi:hypothetical protein